MCKCTHAMQRALPIHTTNTHNQHTEAMTRLGKESRARGTGLSRIRAHYLARTAHQNNSNRGFQVHLLDRMAGSREVSYRLFGKLVGEYAEDYHYCLHWLRTTRAEQTRLP